MQRLEVLERCVEVVPVCPLCAVTGGYVSPVDAVGRFATLPRMQVGAFVYITDAPRRW